MAFCSSSEENYSLENVEISQHGVDLLKLALNQVSDDEMASALIAVEGDEELIQALGDAAAKIELSQEKTPKDSRNNDGRPGNRRHRKSHNNDSGYRNDYTDAMNHHSTEIKYNTRSSRPSYKSTKKH